MKVYLVLKHPRYPYGSDIKYLEAATIEACFVKKQDAQFIVDTKNEARRSGHYMWSVQTKVVKE